MFQIITEFCWRWSSWLMWLNFFLKWWGKKGVLISATKINEKKKKKKNFFFKILKFRIWDFVVKLDVKSLEVVFFSKIRNSGRLVIIFDFFILVILGYVGFYVLVVTFMLCIQNSKFYILGSIWMFFQIRLDRKKVCYLYEKRKKKNNYK